MDLKTLGAIAKPILQMAAGVALGLAVHQMLSPKIAKMTSKPLEVTTE